MLDAFLAVAYDHELRQSEGVKLANVLSALPEEDLRKLATGEAKLSFAECSPDGEDRTWLGKYKGTPLFDQALELEKAELEAEVAQTAQREQERASDALYRTRDQIRLQKKMLDLDLVAAQNGGSAAPTKGPEQPMAVIPNGEAQGAGAMGDAGPDAEPQKLSSAFLKAAISGGLIDKAVVNTVAKGALTPARAAKAKALGDKLVSKGSKMVGNFGRGGQIAGGTAGKGLALARQGAHMSDLMGKLGSNMLSAALQIAKKNPKLVGAGIGAAGGAIAGGPNNRLGGALGGAALGAAGGSAAAGIGGRMAGPGGKGFTEAAGGYVKDLATKAKGMVGKAVDPAQYAVTPKPPLPAGAPVQAHAAGALDKLDAMRGRALPGNMPMPGKNNVQLMKAAARFHNAAQALEA